MIPETALALRAMLDQGHPLHLHRNGYSKDAHWRLIDSWARTRNCGTDRCFELRLRNVRQALNSLAERSNRR